MLAAFRAAQTGVRPAVNSTRRLASQVTPKSRHGGEPKESLGGIMVGVVAPFALSCASVTMNAPSHTDADEALKFTKGGQP